MGELILIKENMKKWFLLATVLFGWLSANILNAQDLGDAKANTFRVMSYNVRNGKGMDDSVSLRRVADAILKVAPDVVAVQELDSVTGRSKQVDVLRALGEEVLMYPTYAPAIDFNGGKYGVGMLSKEKPLGFHYLPLPGREERRTLLCVEFEKFVFCCTHLSLTEEDRALSLPIIRAEAAKTNKPLLIAGDWNAEPTSAFVQEIQKDFVILTDTTKKTFPASEPEICIDYIACYKNKELPLARLFTWVPEEAMASDHRPVVVDVRLKAKKEEIFYEKPYLQDPTSDGITVMWQTKVPTYSWVEYGTDTLHLQKTHTLVDGQVLCNGLHNKVRLTNIQPGQKYYYRVCSREILVYKAYEKQLGETAVSPFYTFTTPEKNEGDFT